MSANHHKGDRMDVLEQWECPEHGQLTGQWWAAFDDVRRCGHHACTGLRLERVQYVRADAGVVSAEAHARAVNALFAFAQERWGWGSDEHADVADAVEVVSEALDHPRGAVGSDAREA